MRQLLFILLVCFGYALEAQTNYEIVINTPDAYQGNLFFKKGGDHPRNVMIISPDGEELFVENWRMKGGDFKVNDNNHLTYFDRSTKAWFVMDSLGQEVDSVYCANGFEADNHDFIALEDGGYVLFAYDVQPYAMDTVVEDGDPNALIEGVILQELDADHNLIFEWSSWDHFHVTENQHLAPWTNDELNFIHTNSVDIDDDGHFIISNRNLDELTKIHRTTGEIIWRWGGTQNDFEFVNDYPFTHQHTLRCLGENKYLLYDNGNHSSDFTGVPNFSRAVEYELDLSAMTCTKTWEYVHPDSLFTPSIGSTQRLPNGNTLIDFGNLQGYDTGSVIVEVTPENEVVFQLEYDNGGNLYRAHKFDWYFYDHNTESVFENQSSQRKLVKVLNLLGQEVEITPNILQLHVFSDGTVEKQVTLSK
ncbi:MAG: hypothetical protein CL847_04925 [Crocinitomicaceae bacterium]|nr:hypothetical protein [Crocinitomicaceae bacterium]|tara:strand:- start:6895 stop:8151 length:1257 start_codon:yes stop_codon:yes gene_type:complete